METPLKELQIKLKKEEENKEIKEKEFNELFDNIQNFQEQFGDNYAPKWNFGFNRKCPACKSDLNKRTNDNHILYICTKCDYKYAPSISITD